jgi:hypothetical protein
MIPSCTDTLLATAPYGVTSIVATILGWVGFAIETTSICAACAFTTKMRCFFGSCATISAALIKYSPEATEPMGRIVIPLSFFEGTSQFQSQSLPQSKKNPSWEWTGTAAQVARRRSLNGVKRW